MSNVSLARYYFVLYDGALTLKMSEMALNAFCDKTLHILGPQEKMQCYIKNHRKYMLSSRALCTLHTKE